MAEFKRPNKRRLVGGVDTHANTHHAAIVLMNGRRLADREFPATRSGYADLLEWMRSFGRVHSVGVEGTGSYGAALTRHLAGAKVKVVEVNRPDRQQRRSKGKSDPLDAYAAAEAVLADRARTVPKAGTGIVESIRALHLIRAGAVKARTACLNELQALLVTAPAELREQLVGLKGARLAEACARLRPTPNLADPTQGVKAALRHLAARHRALSREIDDAYAELKALLTEAQPELLAIRRTAEGLSKREIIRCLKRYVAREIYKIIIRSNAANDISVAA